MMQFRAYAFTVLTSLGSCMWVSCGPAEKSELDHTFGVTSRARTVPLASCEKQGGSDPNVQYVQTVLDSLTSANPATFKGLLASSKFCLRVIESSELNASADTTTGIIQMNTQALRESIHDADVAAILAHELAHITMNHVYTLEHDKVAKNSNIEALNSQLTANERKELETKAGYFPELADILKKDVGVFKTLTTLESYSDIEYAVNLAQITLKLSSPTQQEKSDFFDQLDYIDSETGANPKDHTILDKSAGWKSIRLVLEKSFAPLAALQSKRSELIRQIRTIPRDKIIDDGAGAERNWKEQEADEVGFELYLRAGYKADRYTSIDKIMLSKRATEKECNDLLTKGEVPARGSQSHPSSCWRIFNNNREKTLHTKEYAPFLKNSKLTIKAGELEKIKAGL
ncbi:MAG TPA: M48 family metalloprotease [Oligoflexus sp.]|uniref:M48 family metalloprotease n=1 Tax=Oligoflexus sp. TaxID=1971216 RepID=UPI002D4F19EA|nr:M48 family metalloprotease [Oligoflexus sp.]HYX33358.1 M48 family metalloprotease [Oligoflexus sp.]